VASTKTKGRGLRPALTRDTGVCFECRSKKWPVMLDKRDGDPKSRWRCVRCVRRLDIKTRWTPFPIGVKDDGRI
jgi:hypothetical protein